MEERYILEILGIYYKSGLKIIKKIGEFLLMENTLNRLVSYSINCYDKIPELWSSHDLITFLVDLSYETNDYNYLLDNNEKIILKRIKTDYYKKRFVRSRTTIKRILYIILQVDNIHDITLTKERNGRIIVLNDINIYICISYSHDFVALTIAKCKIGMDIERIAPQYPKSILSYRLFSDLALEDSENRSFQIIQLWTRLEAYSKLIDRIPYKFLSDPKLPDDAYYLSYMIDERYVLSLAFRSADENTALFFHRKPAFVMITDQEPDLSNPPNPKRIVPTTERSKV